MLMYPFLLSAHPITQQSYEYTVKEHSICTVGWKEMLDIVSRIVEEKDEWL
jgi:hypothetical protein